LWQEAYAMEQAMTVQYKMQEIAYNEEDYDYADQIQTDIETLEESVNALYDEA
jgi:hypothetical protein